MSIGLSVTRLRLCALVGAMLLVGAMRADAQVRYAVGQDVVPVFEGWERNADGSFNFVFGYMNRNYEEPLDIPVGPANSFEPGPAGHISPKPRHVPPDSSSSSRSTCPRTGARKISCGPGWRGARRRKRMALSCRYRSWIPACTRRIGAGTASSVTTTIRRPRSWRVPRRERWRCRKNFRSRSR